MIFLTKYALSLSFSLSLIHTCSHSHSLTLTDLGRVNRASTKSVVKLQEIGPRMSLQLIKIEEGLCSGGVIFSEYGMLIFSLSMLLVIRTSSCVDLKQ